MQKGTAEGYGQRFLTAKNVEIIFFQRNEKGGNDTAKFRSPRKKVPERKFGPTDPPPGGSGLGSRDLRVLIFVPVKKNDYDGNKWKVGVADGHELIT